MYGVQSVNKRLKAKTEFWKQERYVERQKKESEKRHHEAGREKNERKQEKRQRERERKNATKQGNRTPLERWRTISDPNMTME